jgi:DMSO reductase anchor subunit
MHPAYSVILFTTASGAGYGLLALLGLVGFNHGPASSLWFGATALVVALGLITVGLLSSTFHLGRPERAWRAFSQWRSSWLSREGVAAVATYVPAALLFLTILAGSPGLAAPFGLLAAAGAAATVYCTGMIYASLRPIRQWRHPLVVPGYLALAAFSGAALLTMLSAFWNAGAVPAALAVLAGVGGFALKRAYWNSIDAAPPTSTPETATGLGAIGTVRALDPPHTETNYLLREMGFRIARKHATRLRSIALLAGFAGPVALLLLGLAIGGATAVALTTVAALLSLLGLLVERWLMFAEATHTVTLYYPAASR